MKRKTPIRFFYVAATAVAVFLATQLRSQAQTIYVADFGNSAVESYDATPGTTIAGFTSLNRLKSLAFFGVSPVSEPEPWALIAGGLGLLNGMQFIRRRGYGHRGLKCCRLATLACLGMLLAACETPIYQQNGTGAPAQDGSGATGVIQKHPQVGMTQDQVQQMYGNPNRISHQAGGDMWFYQPDAKHCTIFWFSPDGIVDDFSSNE